MRRYLATAVAAGLMAGVVLAPAQAEEQEPLPVLPCVDFDAGFIDEMRTEQGRIKDAVLPENTVWIASIEVDPEYFTDEGGGTFNEDYGTYGFTTTLPQLRIFVPKATEVVPSVWSPDTSPVWGTKEGVGCDYYNPVRIDYTWLSKSNFTSTVEEGTAVSEATFGCAEGASSCRYFGMKSINNGPARNTWLQIIPKVWIDNYGQYVNVGDFNMTFAPDWTTQKQSKTVQVSYTTTVVPPTEPGNELPVVPDEPMGISEGYDFGKVNIFDYKRGEVKITNIGTEDLTLSKAKIVDVDGNEAPEFSVTEANCGKLVAPGKTCTAKVQFFPREQGALAAFINVTSNSEYPLQIPLNGVGTYTEPESVVEAEKEAEANGTEPVYEVAEPEKVEVAGATTKNGKYVVKAKKKKIKVEWKAPDTDQPVTGYEIRSKFKKKSFKKWKDVDPMPNEKGWIKASVKAEKPGNYKVQVTSSTPWVERGDKATVKIKKQ